MVITTEEPLPSEFDWLGCDQIQKVRKVQIRFRILLYESRFGVCQEMLDPRCAKRSVLQVAGDAGAQELPLHQEVEGNGPLHSEASGPQTSPLKFSDTGANSVISSYRHRQHHQQQRHQ